MPNARANLTAGYPRPKYNLVTPGNNTGRMRSQLMSDQISKGDPKESLKTTGR